MDTVEISGRSDFALWAIQRAQEIVRHREVAVAVRQWLSSPQIGLDSSFWLVG